MTTDFDREALERLLREMLDTTEEEKEGGGTKGPSSPGSRVDAPPDGQKAWRSDEATRPAPKGRQEDPQETLRQLKEWSREGKRPSEMGEAPAPEAAREQREAAPDLKAEHQRVLQEAEAERQRIVHEAEEEAKAQGRLVYDQIVQEATQEADKLRQEADKRRQEADKLHQEAELLRVQAQREMEQAQAAAGSRSGLDPRILLALHKEMEVLTKELQVTRGALEKGASAPAAPAIQREQAATPERAPRLPVSAPPPVVSAPPVAPRAEGRKGLGGLFGLFSKGTSSKKGGGDEVLPANHLFQGEVFIEVFPAPEPRSDSRFVRELRTVRGLVWEGSASSPKDGFGHLVLVEGGDLPLVQALQALASVDAAVGKRRGKTERVQVTLAPEGS